MKSRTILLFLTVILAILFVLSRVFPDEGVDMGNTHLRFTNLHNLLQDREPVAIKSGDTTIHQSLRLQDSVEYYHRLVDSGDLRFWLPEPHYFDSFWQAVETAREQGRMVRILHYGDSQIEMDHITGRLRAYMQQTYGGGGPGMIPFQTITPSFSIRQSSNGELTHLAAFGDSLAVRSKGDYGPMMQSFRLVSGEGATTVKSSTSSHADSRIKQFSRIKLIYNSHGGMSVDLSTLKGKKEKRHTSISHSGIASADFVLDTATSAFHLAVNGSADLYCILVDDSCGVAVDNIPMRGCSGQQFTLVGEKMLTEAYNQMDIGMIIMQFGGNSVPYIKDTKAISTYCKSIGKQIDHVRKCCPEAKVLFIGPSDMSHRSRGEMQTYPMLPDLIDSLAATATAHGAAYWSIYHAMGGWNSMLQWSRQGLAGSDYIHFSQKGADLMGDNLAKAFDNCHVLYHLDKRLQQQKSRAEKSHTAKPKSKRRKGGRR